MAGERGLPPHVNHPLPPEVFIIGAGLPGVTEERVQAVVQPFLQRALSYPARETQSFWQPPLAFAQLACPGMHVRKGAAGFWVAVAEGRAEQPPLSSTHRAPVHAPPVHAHHQCALREHAEGEYGALFNVFC